MKIKETLKLSTGLEVLPLLLACDCTDAFDEVLANCGISSFELTTNIYNFFVGLVESGFVCGRKNGYTANHPSLGKIDFMDVDGTFTLTRCRSLDIYTITGNSLTGQLAYDIKGFEDMD